MPSQLLATNPQEIQYIHPPLQTGYVQSLQYQPAAAAAAAVANRLSQQLQPQVPRAGAGAQFSRPGADAAFPQSLCMSSVLLAPNGLQGKEGGCGRGVPDMPLSSFAASSLNTESCVW